MQNQLTVESPETHLFNDEEMSSYTTASNGQRFLNLLIDTIIAQYGLGLLSGVALVSVWTAVDETSAYNYLVEGSVSFTFISLFLSLAINLVYYTCSEKLFKGFTLGKLITGTQAIRTDGLPLTWRNALLRTLTRWVPFEPFSAISNSPWHDRWTSTQVIKKR